MKPNDSPYITALRFIFRAWIVTVLCGPVLYMIYILATTHHSFDFREIMGSLGLTALVAIFSAIFSLPGMFIVSLVTYFVNKGHITMLVKKLAIGLATTFLLLTTYYFVANLTFPHRKNPSTFSDDFGQGDLICVLAYWLVAMVAIILFKLKEPQHRG